jgi:hypothetical protein
LSQVRALPPLPVNALIFLVAILVFSDARLIVVIPLPRRRRHRIVGASLPTHCLRGWRFLRRKEYIAARPAQVRPAGSQTPLNATGVWHIGSAKPERVRGAGFALLIGSLSEGGGLEQNKECGGRTPVIDSMRRHDFLLRCQITDVR